MGWLHELSGLRNFREGLTLTTAIYARKSTDQFGVADEQKSITRQVEMARAFAASRGWTVLESAVFVDDGVSGAEFANRPGFLRLMNALRPKPGFDTLIMSEESRLGREAIETAYALKQIITAGVRVFFYLENRERTLESATDKILMSVTAFADELERERARQRTYDAMARKARAGHVTGGRVFGYDNVEVLGDPDAHGRRHRQRVERTINESEAKVVRRIFELCHAGTGYTRIAKTLNVEGAPCPRPQRGRPAGWAPSSVNEILHRPLYRGEIVWNKSRKRDRWGQQRQQARPSTEWMSVNAPALRIVPEQLWQSVQVRLARIRAGLQEASGGRMGVRQRDVDSNYLLPGFARCAVCGSGMAVMSRNHGANRAHFYGCLANHKRGAAVCANGVQIRMENVDRAVLGALASDVLKPEVVDAVIRGVIDAMSPDRQRGGQLDVAAELVAVDREIARLTEAIATAGDIPPLVAALQGRQARRTQLLAARQPSRHTSAPSRHTLEQAVRARLEDWRGLLTRNVQGARQLLREVLEGPLKFTPENGAYRFEGHAAMGRLLGTAGLATLMASPKGIEYFYMLVGSALKAA